MIRPRSRLDVSLLALCALVPAWLAVARAANVADAAHDEAVVRAVGLGWTGAWRALDAPIASLFTWLPFGTRAFRASIAAAAMCGAAGGALFVATRGLLASYAESKRLAPVLAAIASLTATLCVGFQIEAQAPAGGTIGAFLALLPLAILLSGDRVQSARFSAAAFACGLAASYEPVVGVAAIGSVVTAVVVARASSPPLAIARENALRGAIAFAAGCAPFFIALVRMHRQIGVSLGSSVFASPLGERGESTHGVMLVLVRDELGWLTCGLALVGAGLALASKRARASGAGALVIAVVGLASMAFGALGTAAGDTRYGSPVLAAIGAITMLGAVAMHAGVRAVAAARIPFAPASAAMIVVLAMTFPVRAADEALLRCDERVRSSAAVWNDVAWGPLPVGAVVFVSDRRVATRMLAARAAGSLRGDLAIVPTYDLAGSLANRELTREPKLQPFWRDMALISAPDEWSLSSLAASRPLVMPFEPKWERTLARHLVPVGLFARFESEPRGTSDRRKALDAFIPERERLDLAITSPRDPELLAPTATLLRARALGLAASGDRDLIGRALDDLRPFSPSDPVAAALVKRVLASRGIIDVKDLAP